MENQFKRQTLTMVIETSTGKKITLTSTDERSIAYNKVFTEGEVGTINVMKNNDGSFRLCFPDNRDRRITKVKVMVKSVKLTEVADPLSDDSIFA